MAAERATGISEPQIRYVLMPVLVGFPDVAGRIEHGSLIVQAGYRGVFSRRTLFH
jgi:hypothetical protein